MTIDFEKDQQDLVDKTASIQSLADQIQMLEGLNNRIETSENNLKDLKKENYIDTSIELLNHMCELYENSDVKNTHYIALDIWMTVLEQKTFPANRITFADAYNSQSSTPPELFIRNKKVKFKPVKNIELYKLSINKPESFTNNNIGIYYTVFRDGEWIDEPEYYRYINCEYIL